MRLYTVTRQIADLANVLIRLRDHVNHDNPESRAWVSFYSKPQEHLQAYLNDAQVAALREEGWDVELCADEAAA